MDKEKIMQLCNQIEMIIVTVCDTGYTLQPGDEEAIFNRTKAIMDEVSEPPKTNAERIRQMTVEELADWITDGHDLCDLCQFSVCRPEFECEKGVLEWLKQEVKTNDEW